MERKTAHARVRAYEAIKIGSLVDIYFCDYHINSNRSDVGLVVDIVGYKVDVLRNGHIEVWDIHDLEKMARWKRDAKQNRAT